LRHRKGGKEQAKALRYLTSFLLAAATILCVVISFRTMSLQSSMALMVFNVLFISLPFQLKGSLSRKLCLLALGNVTGLSWNYVFASFSAAATVFFGKIFLDAYTVFFPFVSSIWIVSFWALSLTVLRRKKTCRGVNP
jgi:hypothetical protein